MKDLKEIMIWHLLKQICVIVCFTTLAISFEKWWIVLFALFFQEGIKASTGENDNDES